MSRRSARRSSRSSPRAGTRCTTRGLPPEPFAWRVEQEIGSRRPADATPFLPARRSLKALREAGIDRGEVYVTNAVKHFKFEERGKRRLHQKPKGIEVKACRPWLESELDLIAPDALVLLGATAAKALLGPSFRVSRERGALVDSELAPVVAATIHPSAILRERDEASRVAEREAFAADLAVVPRALARD